MVNLKYTPSHVAHVQSTWKCIHLYGIVVANKRTRRSTRWVLAIAKMQILYNMLRFQCVVNIYQFVFVMTYVLRWIVYGVFDWTLKCFTHQLLFAQDWIVSKLRHVCKLGVYKQQILVSHSIDGMICKIWSAAKSIVDFLLKIDNSPMFLCPFP